MFTSQLINISKILLFIFFSAIFLKIFFIDALFIPSRSMEPTLLEGDFVIVNKFVYGAKTPGNFPFTNIKMPRIEFPVFKNIERNDIVAYEQSEKNGNIIVKRCIAIAGDSLTINNGTAIVNNIEAFSWSNIMEKNNSKIKEFDLFPIRIPKKGDTIKLDYNNYQNWKQLIEREGHIFTSIGLKIFIDNKESGFYILQKDYCYLMGDNFLNSIDSRTKGFFPVDNILGKVIFVYWSIEPGTNSFVSIIKNIRFGRIGKFLF